MREDAPKMVALEPGKTMEGNRLGGGMETGGENSQRKKGGNMGNSKVE